MHHIGMSTAPALYTDLAYKPLEDFEMIGLVTEVPMTIVARKDFEPATLQDLVTYVKANADKVTFANAGIGAASHLCGLLFQTAAGVKLQEVPYQGTGPALTDLVGGQVDFMCDQTTNTTGQITAGKVKAYAVTTAGAGEEPARPAHHDRGRDAAAPGQRVARSLRPGRHAAGDRPEAVRGAEGGTGRPGGHRPDGQARHRAGPGGPTRPRRRTGRSSKSSSAPGRRSSPTPGSRPPEWNGGRPAGRPRTSSPGEWP